MIAGYIANSEVIAFCGVCTNLKMTGVESMWSFVQAVLW